MQIGISVIICCYNSGWIIARTLEGLKNQIIPLSLNWEVVLVDNNCQDNTCAVARQTMLGANVDFTIVSEPNPGLANARRKGIDTVKYDIVLYCDDDNILCPDYVSTMYSIMRSQESVGAAGGMGIAEFTAEPEDQVLKYIKGYAIGSQKDGRKDWLFGAGVALRTRLVKEVYYHQKCYLMGRQGTKLLSGDDSELVMSMVNRGYSIYPTDDVYYTHVLKNDRLTNEYCRRLRDGFVLPEIAFQAMRAAIYETGFSPIIEQYKAHIKCYIKFSVLFWRPTSKQLKKHSKKELKKYNYWGLFTLYKIYREWNSIHVSHVLKKI